MSDDNCEDNGLNNDSKMSGLGARLQYAYWVTFHRDMKVVVGMLPQLCNIFTSRQSHWQGGMFARPRLSAMGVRSLPLLWQGSQENVVTHAGFYIESEIRRIWFSLWPLSRWHCVLEIRRIYTTLIRPHPRCHRHRVYVQAPGYLLHVRF